MRRGNGDSLYDTTELPRVSMSTQSWSGPNAAMDLLFELFPDKYPVLLNDANGEWTFELQWPRHLLETVDPLLPERARTCFGISLPELDHHVEIRRFGDVDYVFSMFHSWALLAPALVAERKHSMPNVVVHVDAHHDLSSSLMIPTGAAFLLQNDLFRGECSLRGPDSIRRTIHSGLINKASFLTAFIAGSPSGSLTHISQGISAQRFSLEPTVSDLSFGDRRTRQIGIKFIPCDKTLPWTIVESSHLPEITLRGDEHVWLDIDLDAFCNRFDGDSDRSGRRGSHEEQKLMQEQIGAFLDSLKRSSWIKSVTAVSVAASPGFFPSEYWEIAIPAISQGVEELVKVL